MQTILNQNQRAIASRMESPRLPRLLRAPLLLEEAVAVDMLIAVAAYQKELATSLVLMMLTTVIFSATIVIITIVTGLIVHPQASLLM